MLVVSLKGINQRFWSYLGSVHYKAPLAVKLSYRVHLKIISVLRLDSARQSFAFKFVEQRLEIEPIVFKSLPGDIGCGVRELYLYFPTHYFSGGKSALIVIDSAAKTKHSRGKSRQLYGTD